MITSMARPLDDNSDANVYIRLTFHAKYTTIYKYLLISFSVSVQLSELVVANSFEVNLY